MSTITNLRLGGNATIDAQSEHGWLSEPGQRGAGRLRKGGSSRPHTDLRMTPTNCGSPPLIKEMTIGGSLPQNMVSSLYDKTNTAGEEQKNPALRYIGH